MTPLKIDPEFHDLCAPLAAEELIALKASLRKDGCRDAICVWNGVIVDGHHRHALCVEEKIPFKTREMKFPDRNAVKTWMIQNQFARRNLTREERVRLALALEPLIAKDADARMKSGKPADPPAKLPEGKTREDALTRIEKGDTRDRLAQLAGVSAHTFERAKEIVKSGNAEAIRTMNAKGVSAGLRAMGKPAPKRPPPKSGDRDETGRELPDKLKPVFARRHEIVSFVQEISRLTGEVLGRWKKKDELYWNLSQPRFLSAMNNAKAELRACVPYAVCVYCKGRGCKACGSQGWVDKLRYDGAPKEMKRKG